MITREQHQEWLEDKTTEYMINLLREYAQGELEAAMQAEFSKRDAHIDRAAGIRTAIKLLGG